MLTLQFDRTKTLRAPEQDLPLNPESLLAAIVESSNDAIVGKSLDGTVLSWNAAAERIFGYSADEIIGESIRRLIPASRQDEEDRILAAISAGERVETFGTVRLHKDGSQRHVEVTVSPVRDAQGQVIAASKVARDVTEARRMEQALSDSETRFRLMADNISQLAWIAEADGAIHWYNRRWYDYTGTDLEQMDGWGWRTVHHPDHIERVERKFRECIMAGVWWEDTFPLRGTDGRYRWFLSRASPLRREGTGEVVCWFGTNTDITEQMEAEKRIEILMLEVNHRSKNMLAMIQSLARRSASHGAGNGDFVRRLEQRIASLSANQDLLVRRMWADIPLDELVEVQLGFLGEGLGQVARSGASVMITPVAAETLGMALHELATNALKYGALSVPEGRVHVGWSALPDGGLMMEWVESGGPLVVPPERRGFGSRLISDLPRGKLAAEVTSEFASAGLRWTMTCPAEGVLT